MASCSAAKARSTGLATPNLSYALSYDSSLDEIESLCAIDAASLLLSFDPEPDAGL